MVDSIVLTNHLIELDPTGTTKSIDPMDPTPRTPMRELLGVAAVAIAAVVAKELARLWWWAHPEEIGAVLSQQIYLDIHHFQINPFGGFHKGTPITIHFSRIFHYKPSILGYSHLWKPPFAAVFKIAVAHLMVSWLFVPDMVYIKCLLDTCTSMYVYWIYLLYRYTSIGYIYQMHISYLWTMYSLHLLYHIFLHITESIYENESQCIDDMYVHTI